MANSRLSNRASFFAEVDVLSVGEGMPQRLWGQNLSEAGIFLQTTKPFHPGDRISLRFDVHESEVHVRAAEVVWVKPFEPINVDGTLPGIGVRFLSVDPPSRSAIRRYVHKDLPPNDSDVPAPPPAAELDEGEYMSVESLKPLSLPPFDAAPPAEPMAASPSLPPDEALAGEDTEHDTEHPLAGWRFEVLPDVEEEQMPPPVASHEARKAPPPKVTMPPLDASFDEEAHDTLPPFSVSLPPFEASGAEVRWNLPSMPPHLAAPGEADADADAELFLEEHDDAEAHKDHTKPYGLIVDEDSRPGPALDLSFNDESPREARRPKPPSPAPLTELPSFPSSAEGFTASLPPMEKQERGPDVFELAAHRKVDNEFFEGRLSVLELPQAEGRGMDPRSTRKLRVAWAAGLLLAGGGLGVWFGYEPAAGGTASVTTTAAAEATPSTTLPAPKPVAEAEKGLLADSSTTLPAATTTPAAATAPESAASTVPFSSPEQIATSKPGKLPRKETRAAAAEPEKPDLSLTSAGAVSSSSPSAGVKVEYGRITVPVESGRVARSFGLANPPRVVVDLVDAEFPGHKNDEVGDKGVLRVRYGRPDPLHVRVVVELSGDKAPSDITTLKKGSSLSVAWR